MRKNLTCLLGAAIVALSGCGGTDRTADPARADTRPAPAAAPTRATDVDRDATRIAYEGRDGETALELLRDAGYDVQTERSDLGEYVTAIGDVRATRTTYWLFSVDGTLASQGADRYQTSDGERIEWRFGS